MAEPSREKLRNEMEAPKEDMSKTDRENKEPSLAIPRTDTVEPMRLNLRSDRVAPK
jgi:hypothetical protein